MFAQCWMRLCVCWIRFCVYLRILRTFDTDFAHVVQLFRMLDTAYAHAVRLLRTYGFGLHIVGLDKAILSRWSNITVHYAALVVI